MATSIADFCTKENQNCPICLSDFNIPRQLPCMHSFCEQCLQGYLSSQEEELQKLEKFKCPICRQDVPIFRNGKPISCLASQFPVNRILQSIIGDSKEKVNQICDVCHNVGVSNQAQDICVVCEETLCNTCSTVHQNQKLSRNHALISVNEILSNPQHVMKIAKGFTCPEHDGEAIDFYCQEHKIACCSKCCIINHRKCANVSDLKKELPRLLQETNPDSINEHMKQIESYLKTFQETNESNISNMESQVNDLTTQITDLRKKINNVLDEMENKIKLDGHIICKEEIIRKQEENHHCQTLINSIRNSYMLLETVKKYGTETQIFLMTEKMTSQLASYLEQIQEKYIQTETTTVECIVDPLIKLIRRASTDSLAEMVCIREINGMPLAGIIKSPIVEHDGYIDVRDNDDFTPYYTSIACLSSGRVMLTDHINKKVCLLNSDNSVISYKVSCEPCEICVVNDTDLVAVTLPALNKVQFFSLIDEKITPSTEITTQYRYDGVGAAGMDRIVVSGAYPEGGKVYWSLISREGQEVCHPFDCPGGHSYTYVTLDSSFTRVYMCVDTTNELYCFDMDGSSIFIYNDASLDGLCGVAVDRYDNVYVVGYDSNNIHQLTRDGALLQIISDGVPDCPMAICFKRDSDQILLTNDSDPTKLHQYRLR